MSFWETEERMLRLARYRCRFYSWKLGRRVRLMSTSPSHHWWHLPLVYADTGEPI